MCLYFTLFFWLARFILSIPIPRRTIFIEVRRLSKTAGCERRHNVLLVSDLESSDTVCVEKYVQHLKTYQLLSGETMTVYYLYLFDQCALPTLCSS